MESAAVAAEQACSISLRSREDVTLREEATEKRRVADSYLAAIREDIKVAPTSPRATAHGARDEGAPPAAARGVDRS